MLRNATVGFADPYDGKAFFTRNVFLTQKTDGLLDLYVGTGDGVPDDNTTTKNPREVIFTCVLGSIFFSRLRPL